jgi:predicted deacylase
VKMRTTLSIGSASAEPASVAYGKLLCEPFPDGGEAFIALTLVNGAEDGPILWIGSTIHGREIPGIEVIRRVTREVVDPNELRGALVCAMPLNPYGFQMQQHAVPQDGGNVNARFPGDPDGTLSDRLAFVIRAQGMACCDYVIDFHANEPGGIEFACATPCADKDVLRRTLEMAEAFGFPLVRIPREMWDYDRSLIACAQDAGKPAILAEPLSQGILESQSIEAALRGVMNVMKHAGMIDGEVLPQTDIKVAGGHFLIVNARTRKSGLADYLVDGGDWVETGQTLAVVRDPWGNELDRVVSPTRACVRSTAPVSIVNAGQVLVPLLEPHDRLEVWGR